MRDASLTRLKFNKLLVYPVAKNWNVVEFTFDERGLPTGIKVDWDAVAWLSA